jgi:signal transduction histidine kinase
VLGHLDLRGFALRHGVALALAGASLALTAALVPALGGPYFFVAFPAVMGAALMGGTAAGVVCAAAYGLGVEVLVSPGTLRVSEPRAAARLVLASVALLLVVAVAGRLRAALALERRSRAEAEREVAMRASVEERLLRAHARLAGLQELTAALSAALTPAEVAAATFRIGLPLVGARWGAICLRSGDGALALSHHSGLARDEAGELSEIPLDAAHPAAEAVRNAGPVWLATALEVGARTPHRPAWRGPPEPQRDGARAWLPLGAAPATGVLGLGYAEERPFDLVERTFAEAVAAQCAEALARARLHESERSARTRAEQAEAAARRAARLQEQVLSVVGHDLRTPLSAVIMGVALLRKHVAAEAAGPALDRVARSATRIDEIVRDLLDLARARQGLGMVLTRGPVALDEVCAQAIAELEQTRPGRRIRLRASGDGRCEGDRSRVQQAISNLVSNALQHGPEDEEVAVEVQGGPGEVTVRVHNGGAPIPPEVLPEIFEPFRRGPGAGAAAGSVGLGLFIVREIARAHGGEVSVASGDGQGTTLALRLPRRAGGVAREGGTPPPRDALTSYLH